VTLDTIVSLIALTPTIVAVTALMLALLRACLTRDH